MTITDLISVRLDNQQISSTEMTQPREVVEWLGAVQAQDYSGAKWSVASRLPGTTDADIEKAISDKEIIRTWAMRGTLHFLSRSDIYWMLSFLSPRLEGIMGTHFRKLELDKKTLNKSKKIIEETLIDGKQLTRKEIATALQKKKIATNDMRITFMLLHASYERLICFGPRRGKEYTHTLLEEWVKPAELLEYDEALKKLTLRYFGSHGPATMQDFAWWSGLTLTDVKRGLEMSGSKLQSVKIKEQLYWMPKEHSALPKTSTAVFLLAGFDEYIVAYKDRSAVLHPQHVKAVMGLGNGIFNNTVLVNGKVAGVWKRTFQKQKVNIDFAMFGDTSEVVKKKILTASKRFGKFLEMPVMTSFSEG
ncbi:winged helix DNA-binding domain-containing protein [Danxiaibacter flavus]|uniref:Winged helix DNA-binding domain-containing protein n=1 Tax=Danxiaibacter flavus TaxID=3049108 RepID=A0ABV3ZG68_9BACT|nr:winged helix DNA-binding domain-containing protein [Chitinophagaceae bacterium DXS]